MSGDLIFFKKKDKVHYSTLFTHLNFNGLKVVTSIVKLFLRDT